jgi:hypothetical protein
MAHSRVQEIVLMTRCFFIGEKGNAMVPDGIEHVERPSTMLYSPRIPNPYNDQIRVGDNDNSARSKVYYATLGAQYRDIYEFVFACRASKLTDNYYLVGPMPTSVADLKARAVLLGSPELYNIVSGEKMVFRGADADSAKALVHRYMMMGLHYFAMYGRCGFGRSRVLQEQCQSRIVSAGGHSFDDTQGWLLNVSNIPIGMLIDYYRIESGIVGMNAQLSFVKEPEFRYLVYKYLKAVFVAFVKHNGSDEVNEQTNDEEVVSRAARLLNSLL